MKKKMIKDMILWGFLLWLVGYILGIILFMAVPKEAIGWIISPIGILLTLWVLFKKIKSKSFSYHIKLGIVWTLLAIILDYLLLVKLFKPADGYYKLDVYLYYTFTFILPIISGWYKQNPKKLNHS